MLRAGFELATPASYRQKTLALDRSAIGIGMHPPAVRRVASRYTDWAIAAHIETYNIFIMRRRVSVT